MWIGHPLRGHFRVLQRLVHYEVGEIEHQSLDIALLCVIVQCREDFVGRNDPQRLCGHHQRGDQLSWAWDLVLGAVRREGAGAK